MRSSVWTRTGIGAGSTVRVTVERVVEDEPLVGGVQRRGPGDHARLRGAGDNGHHGAPGACRTTSP